MSLPDVQLALRPGIVELGWGHPDPALLPAGDLARAAEQALSGDWRALAYGAEQGPGRLLAALSDRLAAVEGVRPADGQLFITAGTSQGLDLLCTLLTQPGDSVLVEAPVYHLALRIFRDHGLSLVPVPSDGRGLRVDALASALDTAERAGRPPRFLYTVPTFCNPTGASLAPERRHALALLARERALLVLEDDAYREIWFDAAPAPPLGHLAGDHVARLGSFSKVLAPGLRLGWLVAPAALVARCMRSGLLDSGGGASHFAAHVAAGYMMPGLLDGHIERLRAVYRGRRDALVEALSRHLPDGWGCIPPGGGFFVWVEGPAGADTAALQPRAEAAGVSYVPGNRFYAGGDDRHALRLAFSLLPEAELAEGARRLGGVLRHG